MTLPSVLTKPDLVDQGAESPEIDILQGYRIGDKVPTASISLYRRQVRQRRDLRRHAAVGYSIHHSDLRSACILFMAAFASSRSRYSSEDSTTIVMNQVTVWSTPRSLDPMNLPPMRPQHPPKRQITTSTHLAMSIGAPPRPLGRGSLSLSAPFRADR